MSLVFFDTETCGFHGPIVLIQYAYDDGPIELHEVWTEPIWSTLRLIEQFCEEEAVIGFNLAFDWFHIAQTYTTLQLLADKVGEDEEPRDHIQAYAECEADARFGPCVKPKSALDLMLHARKGPYQSTMDRKEIVIRKVPRLLAPLLIQELDRRIPLKDLYFAKNKDKKKRWQIHQIKNPKTNKWDNDFVNVSLKFSPSSALKALAVDALGLDSVTVMTDIAPENNPIEIGWAPYATAYSSAANHWFCRVGSGKKKKEGYAWPGVIEGHIAHWRFHQRARQYAYDDVHYTRELYRHFGSPEHGDDDSVLACLVGASRWRGLAVDVEKIDSLIAKEEVKLVKTPRAPHHVYKYLSEVMTTTEKVTFDEKASTKKAVLEELSRWNSPVAERAKEVLESRKAYTKKILFEKIRDAKRFHPAATVIGSLSGRMSGRTETGDGKKASNLNALGIQHDKEIRSAFPLADGDLVLNGGDFEAFEVSIADARYDDPDLRNQLLTCYVCQKPRTLEQYRDLCCPNCGAASDKCITCEKTVAIYQKDGSWHGTCECGTPKLKGEPENTLRKIHGLFAMSLYPGMTYDEIQATKGTSNDLYDKGKRGIFSQLYGGDENTLVNRLAIELEVARAASQDFATRYKGVGRAKREIFDKFCSMRQPDGIGSKVVWADPEDYVESLTGFRRYFTLENKICRALFLLADNPPKPWNAIKLTVVRRDREQKVGGAVRSALFAAAFQIQAHNMRAAQNHEIQSTGAILCKMLQRLLWDVQPSGIHKWMVQPFNIHDEIMCPSHPSLSEKLEQIVQSFVESKRSLIPLISMDWQSRMQTWAEK